MKFVYSLNVGKTTQCTFRKTGVVQPNGQFYVQRQEGLAVRHGVLTCSARSPEVILTREAGKNDPVKLKLEKNGVYCLEMPLVETASGPDRDRFPELLAEGDFDWVCITSPEAAAVFIEGWHAAGKPNVRVAVVGKGTGRVLEAANEPAIEPQFTPSVANAEHFGPELPKIPAGTNKILYPSSAKASTLLQQGLEKRGFTVMRLNTYDTITVEKVDQDALKQAKDAQVVAIASPSALKAWMHYVGEQVAARIAVAAIGSTSAQAAKNLGLERIYFPDEPGVDTFVETIMTALEEAQGYSKSK